LIIQKHGDMSQLKPDTKYIYEHADGVTYAREWGAPPDARFVIGWDQQYKGLLEDKMWGEIRRMARTDPALQDLLERAIVYYNLKKDHDGKAPMWHPV
jgi:hypothetical protein